MDSTEEYRPKQHPEERWQPTPDHRDCWSHNGSCTRDRGEMVTKEDRLICRDEILVIVQGHTRHGGIGVELEDLSRKPAPIGVVSDDVEDQ